MSCFKTINNAPSSETEEGRKGSMSSKWTFIILFVKFPLLVNGIFGGKAVEEPHLYPWMVKLNINLGKYGNSKW